MKSNNFDFTIVVSYRYKRVQVWLYVTVFGWMTYVCRAYVLDFIITFAHIFPRTK